MSYQDQQKNAINNNQNNSGEIGNFGTVGNEMSAFFASADLTLREHKVVWHFIRELNGYSLKLKPFTLQEISDGTRLPLNKVSQTLKSLLQKAIIQKIKIDAGKTFHYGFTDGLFYRALPIEDKKECHLRVVKSTNVVSIKSTKKALNNSTDSVQKEVSKAAPVAETQAPKDILNTYKDSYKEDFNTGPESSMQWPDAQVVDNEMDKIWEIMGVKT